MVGALALAVAALGCGPRAPVAAVSPPPTSTAPVGPGPVERVLAAATAPRADRAAPVHAPALDEVARVAAAGAAARYVIAADAVRAAVAAQLGSGLDPYVLTARGDDAAAVAQLVDALGELRAAAGIATVGVAAAEGASGRVIAVAAMPPPEQPIAIAREGAIARVSVPWPWPEPPRAFLVSDDGERTVEAAVIGGAVALAVDCARSPARAVELDAGPALVAVVVDVCGPTPRPPPSIADIGPPARTAVEVEQRLFEQINRDRVAAGLVPLAWDPIALAMARRHAARMHALGFMGHVAPDGEDLTARVKAAGLPARETFENVGLIDGPGRGHLAFMRSPGHRKNLLAERARRGAVGVVANHRDPGWYYVTEVFFEPEGAPGRTR